MNETSQNDKSLNISLGMKSLIVVLVMVPAIFIHMKFPAYTLPFQIFVALCIFKSLWYAIHSIVKNQGRLFAFLALALLVFLSPMVIA
jgi:hypothetical protein